MSLEELLQCLLIRHGSQFTSQFLPVNPTGHKYTWYTTCVGPGNIVMKRIADVRHSPLLQSKIAYASLEMRDVRPGTFERRA